MFKPDAVRLEQLRQDWRFFSEAGWHKNKTARKRINQTLRTKIQHITTLEADKYKAYAEALLWLTFEEDVLIPVMHPALWRQLFPYLKKRYEARERPFVRWMYHAFSFEGVYA